MYCGKCGKRNEVGSKFCGKCGVKVIVPPQEDLRQNSRRVERAAVGHHPGKPKQAEVGSTKAANQEDVTEKPVNHGAVNTMEHATLSSKANEQSSPPVEGKKSRKPLVVIVALLLLVAISATGWMFMGLQNTRAFNDAMEEGNRFLLEGNLEQAQIHFRRAMEINPREPEPYLQMAEIYMEWGEVGRAVKILERGMDAVSDENRARIDDALDNIYIEADVSPTLRDEEEEDSEDRDDPAVPAGPEDSEVCDSPEESDALDATTLALMAFHEFLSNPQTILFTSFPAWAGLEEYSLSWNPNTIRHAALMDLRGDGIPQLLIAPSVSGEVATIGGAPFMIFEYTGQVEVFHEVFDGGGADARGWVFHELAFTSEGQTFLVSNQSQSDRVVRTYFTLEGERLVSVLTTTVYKRNVHADGVWETVVESAYVDGESVTETQWEEAPYEVLGVIERQRVIPEWDVLKDIQPLLRYMEDRVAQGGYEGLLREEEYTWQERYIQFLLDYTIRDEVEGGRHYRLVFLDGEDVPQLLLRLNDGNIWHRFLNYYQGQLMTEFLFFERLYYVPYENRFAINPGGVFYDVFLVDFGMLLEGRVHFYNRGRIDSGRDDERIYFWSGVEFLSREEYLRILEESPKLITGRYWIDGRGLVEISHEEYWERFERAIDMSQTREGAFLEFYTLEEIIEQIRAL